MSDQLIQTIIDNDVTFIVTEAVLEFQKIYNALGDSDIDENFYRCHWKGSCATMYGTKIATCYVPFVIHYFSDKFNLAIEETGKIDLMEEGLTAGNHKKNAHTF